TGAGQDKVPRPAHRLLPDNPGHPTRHEPAATEACLEPRRRCGARMDRLPRRPAGHSDGPHLGHRLRLVARPRARRGISLVEAEESAFETSHHRIMRPDARSRVSYVGVLREAPFWFAYRPLTSRS